MKVVIFDDELSQQPARSQLSFHGGGVELLFFPNADDAVAIVERERPDVVLMDFSMNAERCGADAITALQARRHNRHLSWPRLIVAISANAQANRGMLAAGADDAVPKTHVRGYLQKLFERERLAHREEHL